MGCFTFNLADKIVLGEKTAKLSRAEKENNLYLEFISSDGVKALRETGADYNQLYSSLYYNTTGKSFFYGDKLSHGEIRLLKTKIGKFNKHLFSNVNKFQEWFFLPQVIASKNPITKKHFKNLSLFSNYHRGNNETLQASLSAIGRSLMAEMNLKGMAGIMPQNSLSKIGAEIKRREQEWTKLRLDGDVQAAKDYYKNNIETLSKDSEFEILVKARELFQNPEAMKKLADNKYKKNDIVLEDGTSIIKEYGNGVVEAANQWGQLRDKLWGDMQKALDSNVEALRLFENEFNGLGELRGYFENLQKNLTKQPHYLPKSVFDIFPLVEKVNETVFTATRLKAGMEKIELFKEVKETVANVLSDVQASKHAQERSILNNPRYSRDLMGVLDTYGKNIIKWNYTAKSTLEYLKGMRDLLKLAEGDVLENQSVGLMNFMTDTHRSAMGLDARNSKFGKIARTLTAYQFVSKMFGLRSPMRNGTQSIQNFNHFGYTNVMKALTEIRTTKGLKNIIDAEMELQGFRYVNLEELAVGRHDIRNSNVKFDKETGYEFESSVGFGEKVIQFTEQLANRVGKPMQFVENHVNRAMTFRIAFVEHMNMMKKSKDLVKQEVLQARDSMGEAAFEKAYIGKDIESKVHNTIIKQSSRWASNAVEDLHFLYDAWAKPKYMRSNAGKLQGQFGVFRINHFNMLMQRHINATHELQSLYPSRASMQTLRTYATSMVISSLLSPMLGVDLGYLVQDDTMEFIKNTNKFYNIPKGEDKDRMRKDLFFGKGPLLSLLLGPTFGQLVQYGQISQLIRMDKDNWFTYLAGYKDLAQKAPSEETEELVGASFNFMRRFLYDYPEIYNEGGALSVLGRELSLFPSLRNTAKKEALDTTAKNVLGKFGIDANSYKKSRMLAMNEWLYTDKKTISMPYNKQAQTAAKYRAKGEPDKDAAYQVLQMLANQTA